MDKKADYTSIYDASGDANILDSLVGRIKRGGEIVLAGFYPGSLSFMFAPAFMKEARFRIAAEFTADDVIATRSLIESGALSLEGLISDIAPAPQALKAYKKAFNDPDCLKMVLDWRNAA
jgi:3-hydroxyethyl bacteriochlorophyllide a dehydrogenase